MKYYLTLCLTLSTIINSYSQTGHFIDQRDGNKYQTIVVDKKQWLREHLRFWSPYSYFNASLQNEASFEQGNYFSHHEIGSICPAGWRVASTEDWEEFIDVFVKNNRIPADSISRKQFPSPNNADVVTIRHFDLLQDTLLQLHPIGWVQGKKITNRQTLSLWLSNPKTGDNKYHVHVGELGYVVHTHKHHIIDKPKKIRKFTVRCVCEVPAHE